MSGDTPKNISVLTDSDTTVTALQKESKVITTSALPLRGRKVNFALTN